MRKINYSLIDRNTPKHSKQDKFRNLFFGNLALVAVVVVLFLSLLIVNKSNVLPIILLVDTVSIAIFLGLILKLLSEHVMSYFGLPNFIRLNGWEVHRSSQVGDFSGQVFQCKADEPNLTVISVPEDNLFAGQNKFDFGNYIFIANDCRQEYGFHAVSSLGLDLLNLEQYERIFQLVQIVAEKLDQRASRYEDHRSSVYGNSNRVALLGRRLIKKKGKDL